MSTVLYDAATIGINSMRSGQIRPIVDSDLLRRGMIGPEAGFTVIEMLIAIVILAILGKTAISMTVSTLDSADKSSAEVQVVQHLRRAQATAVTEGCRGIFATGNSGQSYSFGCDYLPYSTATPPVPDSTFFNYYLPTGITISTSALIIFNSRGQCVDSSNVLTTRTVTLTSSQSVTPYDFATGTLRATGFFSYN